MNLKELVPYLCSVEKVSGNEHKFAKILKNMLAEYVQNVEISSNNSVIAKIKSKNETAKTPEIILTAHLDEIGFIVSKICENGLLQLKNCGGVNLKLASFQKVIVHGKQKLTGFTILEKTKNNTEALFVDVGLEKSEVENLISLGDVVNFDFNPVIFENSRICSKNLDDCAGIATIFLILEQLKKSNKNPNLTIVFSSQEETTGAGAITAAYGQNAKVAICLDVSFAKLSCCESNTTLGELGKGPMIGISPILDLNLTNQLLNLAKSHNIPFQLEIMNGLTSTDADKIARANFGIKTCLCSIPLKYMHSPVEMIDFKDIEYSAKLIEVLISNL